MEKPSIFTRRPEGHRVGDWTITYRPNCVGLDWSVLHNEYTGDDDRCFAARTFKEAVSLIVEYEDGIRVKVEYPPDTELYVGHADDLLEADLAEAKELSEKLIEVLKRIEGQVGKETDATAGQRTAAESAVSLAVSVSDILEHEWISR